MYFFHSIILVSALFFSGCQSEANLELLKKGRAKITAENVGIQKYSILDWKVGYPKRKYTVSKGISVVVGVPDFSNSTMELLADKLGANAHYLKLYQKSYPKNTLLASYLIQFESTAKSRVNRFRFRKIRKVTLSIGYSAWAISTRLASMACPQLGHNLSISKAKIINDKSDKINFTIESASLYSIPEKIENYDLFAKVNGGAILKGDYFFEYAIANINEKNSLMEPIRLPGTLRIIKENSIDLPSCRKYKPKIYEHKGSESFKWNN